jgi:NDP-sugar pyrophosphorylase family protein
MMRLNTPPIDISHGYHRRRMKGMILAAGHGTRLGKLGQATPKVLIDVGGRTLLDWHLDYLYSHGIDRVVVNVHHLPDQIESFLDSYNGPVKLTCVFEEHLLGTAGAVRNALQHLEPGPFLVLYGDVVVREPVFAMLELHRDSGALATLAVHEAETAEGKGVVEVRPDGRVGGFTEKPDAGRIGQQAVRPALVNSGIYVLESEFVSELPHGVEVDFGHDVFPRALATGVPVFAHRLSRPVIDIGTPSGLALARESAYARAEADPGGRSA